MNGQEYTDVVIFYLYLQFVYYFADDEEIIKVSLC